MSGGRRPLQGAYSRLAGGYERRALGLLISMLLLDYADRTLVGALGPTIKRAFGIGDFDLGVLAGAFLIVGAGAAVPIGMLVDKISRTAILAASLALWAAAIGVAGAAVSFAMFFGARLLLGVVTAASGPTVPSMVGDLVSAERRGRALATTNGGLLVGLGVGYVLPATIASFASWRWCFWLLGAGGACLAYAFWRLREPARAGAGGGEPEDGGVWRTVRERNVEPSRGALLDKDPSEMSMWEAAKYTVRVRTDLIALVARSLGDFFLQAVATFGVVFATGWYGISQGLADLVLLAVGVGAIAGVLIMGRASDALIRRGRLNGRIWIGACSYLVACAVLYPAFLTRSLAVAVPLFAVGTFFLAGPRAPLDAVRVDVLVGG